MLASFGYLKYTIYISYFTPHFPRRDAEILMSLYPSMGVKYVSSPRSCSVPLRWHSGISDTFEWNRPPVPPVEAHAFIMKCYSIHFHCKRILSWLGQQLSRNSFFQGAVLDLSANPVGWEGLMEANGILRDIYCFVFHCNLSWESIACIWVTFFFLTSFLIHCYLYEILQICVCTEDKAVGEQQNWGLLFMCWNYGWSEWYGSRMLSSGF